MANDTAKHTPGPWMVGPSDDTLVTHLGKGRLRYEVAAIKGDYSDPETWPVMEANARLIAAAPDLLEALMCLSEWVEDFANKPAEICEFKAAKAALAKARGEAV